MKKLRTRLVSAFLVIMTLLTLLPTSSLAASSTGTGIKPTSNTNYWTTRLLHDGTPYSYKPPMAAGKMLYCLDRGYGYRWGTPSFLNSYTYTSATGADADAVLKTALAQSGMGELDAQQLENFKWMMSFIVDYKGDIPGSLFMAAQTYVWDHQTFKGEGDGDIDGGGYANADTYEMYLGYIDWMLKEKAKEDAEFQRQIEEYAEQGIIATVVEDEAAKWAVYAKSSVKGRQAFFNYYAPRKLVTNTSEPGKPPAGDADITLRKVAAGTTRGLDGAKFNIYRDGQIVGSDVTQNGGIIEVKDVTKGLWSFVETEAPEGYCADSTPISVYVDTTDGDKQYTVTAENYALPDMKITKRDAMSGKPIAGTVFSIKSVTGSYSTSVTTGTDGSATLSAIPAGIYVVREESVPEPYIVTNTEQTVALRPGKTSEVTFVDYEKPGLEIVKKNIANGEPIEGVTYLIEGQPIGVFYLPHCEGIDKDGKYIITDLDQNGNVDTGDSGDRQICGQAIPKAYLGWDFTFNYKNWSLAMQFNGAFGHKIFNGTSMTYSDLSNFPTYNVLADAPARGIKNKVISDYWLENGDYVNFEYLQLSYTFNKQQLKTKYIQNIKLGLAVNNVCTITGYSGLTPMINSASLVQQAEGTTTYGTLGVDDKRIYPLTRTFSFNVGITF